MLTSTVMIHISMCVQGYQFQQQLNVETGTSAVKTIPDYDHCVLAFFYEDGCKKMVLELSPLLILPSCTARQEQE